MNQIYIKLPIHHYHNLIRIPTYERNKLLRRLLQKHFNVPDYQINFNQKQIEDWLSIKNWQNIEFKELYLNVPRETFDDIQETANRCQIHRNYMLGYVIDKECNFLFGGNENGK